MTSKRKVYVVNKGGHDHSDAERFGELVFLSTGAMNRYATSTIYRKFVKVLRGSSPGDYILPTGLTVMTLIACAIFARMHGKLNLLLYRTSRNKEVDPYYVERIIDVDSLLKGGLNDPN